MKYVTLHYITLHYITLHYITLQLHVDESVLKAAFLSYVLWHFRQTDFHFCGLSWLSVAEK
jgi:hypothetical protein